MRYVKRMSRTAHIVWTCIGIGVMASLLIAAMIWGYMMKPSETPCASLQYIIEDRAERLYLSESELNQSLRAEGIYPVGRAMDIISLQRIENTIKHHPMVRTAECYLTPRNDMKIRLTQRVPLVRVQAPLDTYFIDTDRRVMQARISVRDSVLLVTGNVGPQMAATQMADFAIWLQENSYWRTKIHHLYVQSPQKVYIYLKDGHGKIRQEKVVLGSMRGYEQKLKKLRTFLDNSYEATKDKNYYELDIRFKGQVIGRR